jgi:hypothetical protein
MYDEMRGVGSNAQVAKSVPSTATGSGVGWFDTICQ